MRRLLQDAPASRALVELLALSGILLAVQPAMAATNYAPVITGTPATTVEAGKAYSFTPAASDSNGDKLTFVIKNLPSWATFNATTGRISGTVPASTAAGTVYTAVRVGVSDGTFTKTLPEYSITVTAGAAATVLKLTGTPATSVNGGSAYSFKPTLTNTTGKSATFSIQNKPAWASFVLATGQLSGTPASSAAATYSNIVISASNGTTTVKLPAFAITVKAAVVANAKPTISGSPAKTVLAGKGYTFQPTAADPEKAKLTFSIQNKPAWAALNTTTGLMNGTPSAAQIGTYSNIIISVTDGTNSVALPAFAITVTASASGTAALNWVPPTQATTGAGLSGLAGYRIHYGTNASALSSKVQVANAGSTGYVLTNLTSGKWYFAVSAYTSAGAESALSNVGSKTIP